MMYAGMTAATAVLGAGILVGLIYKIAFMLVPASTRKVSVGSYTARADSKPGVWCRQEAAKLSVDALWHDPSFLYFLPMATEKRQARFTRMMELFVWFMGTSFDLCDVVRDRNGAIVSIALWEPHVASAPAMARALRMLGGFVWQLGRKKGWEAAVFFYTLEMKRAKLAPKPHFHLTLLATDPIKQRNGYGSAAIKAQLERSDASAVACYLESSNHANLSFYRKHGFAVVEEVSLPNGHAVHLMLREPSKRATDA